MSFITDLGKGFIRSAVNQVGRDTGKVISNQIFGNAHSTPIRNVSISDKGAYFNQETNESLDIPQVQSYAQDEGWEPIYSSFGGWGIKIFWSTFSLLPAIFLFPWSIAIPIVPIYILYRGIKKMRTTKIIYQKESYSSTQKADKRYKSGYRTEGGNIMNQIELPCTSEQSTKFKSMGWGYIFISIFLFFSAYSLGNSYQKWDSIQSQREHYERFMENAEGEQHDIEWRLRMDKDSSKYIQELNDFKEKYEEASEYLKSHPK